MRQRPVDDGTATSVAVVLPLLGLFLLMPPVITLFARGVGVAGVPLIVIYVFGVWIALIVGAALLVKWTGLSKMPEGMDGRALIGLGLLCGIGFTMSLFIGLLVLAERPDLEAETKIGALLGSQTCVALGAAVLWISGGRREKDLTAQPIGR